MNQFCRFFFILLEIVIIKPVTFIDFGSEALKSVVCLSFLNNMTMSYIRVQLQQFMLIITFMCQEAKLQQRCFSNSTVSVHITGARCDIIQMSP